MTHLTTAEIDELARRADRRRACDSPWAVSVVCRLPVAAAEARREVLGELGLQPVHWEPDPATRTVTATYVLPVYCLLPPYDRLPDVRQLRTDWERQVGEERVAQTFGDYFLARYEEVEHRSGR